LLWERIVIPIEIIIIPKIFINVIPSLKRIADAIRTRKFKMHRKEGYINERV
jgi:hypothetical protein